MKRVFARGGKICAVGLALGLMACETELFDTEPSPEPSNGPFATQAGDPPQGVARDGGIDFGPWRTGDPAALSDKFAAQVSKRYPDGSPLATARVDLTADGFECIDGNRRVEGHPVPDLECRRDVLERRCTWHWRVEFDESNGQVDGARGHTEVFCVGGSSPQ